MINNSKSKSKCKILLLTKVNNENLSSYHKHLDQIFSDPNEYFSTYFKGHEVMIGQPFGKFNQKYLPRNKRSVFGNRSSRKSNYGTINNISKKRASNISAIQQLQSLLPCNKYYINDKELKGIFDNFKHIKENNSSIAFTQSNSLLFHDTHNSHLLLQQKALTNHTTLVKESKALSYKIAKKLKTKPEGLLMMTDGGFRIKNELKDDCSKQIQSKTPKALNDWILNLRNDNDHRYLNVGSLKNPKWQMLIGNKSLKEIIRDPKKTDRKATDFFIKNDYLKEKISMVTYNDFKNTNILNLKNLEVQGKDLLQAEEENINKINGKKIITKYQRNEDEDLLYNTVNNEMIVDNKLLPSLHRKYASF